MVTPPRTPAVRRTLRHLPVAVALAGALVAGATASARQGAPRAEFEARVSALLTERYGDEFARADTTYVKCPAAGFSSDRHYGHQQSCRYEFGSRTLRRGGGVAFFDDFGGGGPFRPTPLTSLPAYRVRPAPCAGSRAVAGFADRRWTLVVLRTTRDRPDACRRAGQVLTRVVSTGPRLATWPLPRDVRSPYADPGYDALDRWTCSVTGSRTRRISCVNGRDHVIVGTLRRRADAVARRGPAAPRRSVHVPVTAGRT